MEMFRLFCVLMEPNPQLPVVGAERKLCVCVCVCMPLAHVLAPRTCHRGARVEYSEYVTAFSLLHGLGLVFPLHSPNTQIHPACVSHAGV